MLSSMCDYTFSIISLYLTQLFVTQSFAIASFVKYSEILKKNLFLIVYACCKCIVHIVLLYFSIIFIKNYKIRL